MLQQVEQPSVLTLGKKHSIVIVVNGWNPQVPDLLQEERYTQRKKLSMNKDQIHTIFSEQAGRGSVLRTPPGNTETYGLYALADKECRWPERRRRAEKGTRSCFVRVARSTAAPGSGCWPPHGGWWRETRGGAACHKRIFGLAFLLFRTLQLGPRSLPLE